MAHRRSLHLLYLLVTASFALLSSSTSSCSVDKCGVCNGSNRACCSFRGTFDGHQCLCDPDSFGRQLFCGSFCQLEVDGCGICDGDGRSCCPDGGVKDMITGSCGPRRFYLDVFEAPGRPDGFPMGEVIAVTRAEPSVSQPVRMRLPMDFRPFPGPLITAYEGETLAVTVYNHLQDRMIDIHWHGLHHKNNAWVDGTSQITGCPFYPGTSRTYTMDLAQHGSYWYHSHVSSQYAEGLQGPLVIRAKTADDYLRQRYPYDYDHVLMMMEWFHEPYRTITSNVRGPHAAFPGYRPQFPWPPVSILLNGRGRFDCTRIRECEQSALYSNPGANDTLSCQRLRRSYAIGECDSNHLDQSAEHLFCSVDGWVRLRLICAASNIPIRVWVDQHPMVIVARDGKLIKPTVAQHVTVPVGQRLDVMVRCNQSATAPATYHVFASSNANFYPRPERGEYRQRFYRELYTYALLRYVDPVQPTKHLSNLNLQPLEIDVFNNLSLRFDDPSVFTDANILAEYRYQPASGAPQPYPSAPAATRRVLLKSTVQWDSQAGSPLEYWLTDNQSFVAPTQPLLHQMYFKGALNLPTPYHPTRPTPTSPNVTMSTYVIDVDLHEVVEFVMLSYSSQQHPWHIHGNDVYLMGAGIVADDAILNSSAIMAALDGFEYDGKHGALESSVPDVPLGDSWTVPPFGYQVFRLRADNPGPWLLHCHVAAHMTTGMALVINVGAKQGYPGLDPPDDDHRCGFHGQKALSADATYPPVAHDADNDRQEKQVAGIVIALLGVVAIVGVAWYGYRRHHRARGYQRAKLTDQPSALLVETSYF